MRGIGHSGGRPGTEGTPEPRRVGAAIREQFTKTLVLAALAAIIGLTLVRTLTGPAAMSAVADASHVVFATMLVVGSLLLLARWRFLDEAGSGWLAFVLLVLAIYLRPELYVEPELGTDHALVSPVDLAVMLLLVWGTRSAAAGVAPTGWRQPVLLGLTSGLALSGARFFVEEAFGPWPVWLLAIVFCAFLVSAVLCTRSVLIVSGMPLVFRWHLAVPLSVGIGFHHFLSGVGAPLPSPVVVGAVVSTVAAMEVLATSLALLQDAFRVQHRRLVELHDRARRAEHAVEHDAELLHECRATVAGLSTASHLLATSAHRLGAVQVSALQSMLDAEMLRLQAILDAKSGSDHEGWFDLDDVLEPVVASLRLQGVDVGMRPSRLRVWGDREIVTTAVHVLLCNAKRHAPGARIEMWTTQRAGKVVLHVADDGPGLPADLSPRLFTRGARGTASPGEGLGLYSARKGLREHGADLSVVPCPRGALFAVTLPMAAPCSA